MSLDLEEIRLRNTEKSIEYALNFESESVDVFKDGIFAIEISFKDIDTLQEQIDNNK